MSEIVFKLPDRSIEMHCVLKMVNVLEVDNGVM